MHRSAIPTAPQHAATYRGFRNVKYVSRMRASETLASEIHHLRKPIYIWGPFFSWVSGTIPLRRSGNCLRLASELRNQRTVQNDYEAATVKKPEPENELQKKPQPRRHSLSPKKTCLGDARKRMASVGVPYCKGRNQLYCDLTCLFGDVKRDVSSLAKTSALSSYSNDYEKSPSCS